MEGSGLAFEAALLVHFQAAVPVLCEIMEHVLCEKEKTKKGGNTFFLLTVKQLSHGSAT